LGRRDAVASPASFGGARSIGPDGDDEGRIHETIAVARDQVAGLIAVLGGRRAIESATGKSDLDDAVEVPRRKNRGRNSVTRGAIRRRRERGVLVRSVRTGRRPGVFSVTVTRSAGSAAITEVGMPIQVQRPR
jgi:hypothetical protein